MAKQATENPLTLGPEKVADRLGLATGMVRKMLYDGTLPGFKCGKRWLIPVKALEAWVDNQSKVVGQ